MAGSRRRTPQRGLTPAGLAQLLPYIEQDNVYKVANAKTAIFGGGANPAMPTPQTISTCSGARRTPARPERAVELPDVELPVRRAGPITYLFFFVDNDMGGVMYRTNKTTIVAIDGTSNTLGLGECLSTRRWASGLRSGGHDRARGGSI